MEKSTGLLVKCLVLAALLFIGTAYSAKADTFSATANGNGSKFTGVNVYWLDNHASSNPFGLTIACSNGCNADPFTTGGPPPFGVGTVVFWDSGFSGGPGFLLSGIAGDSVSIDGGGSTLFTGTESNPTFGTTAANTTETYTTNATGFTSGICAAGLCNSYPAAGSITLTYEGNGIFEVTDTSLNYVFSLAPTATPEPSSLLMLGSGLLGLLGFRACVAKDWPQRIS
jgi:PEP-CTERM motif